MRGWKTERWTCEAARKQTLLLTFTGNQSLLKSRAASACFRGGSTSCCVCWPGSWAQLLPLKMILKLTTLTSMKSQMEKHQNVSVQPLYVAKRCFFLCILQCRAVVKHQTVVWGFSFCWEGKAGHWFTSGIVVTDKQRCRQAAKHKLLQCGNQKPMLDRNGKKWAKNRFFFYHSTIWIKISSPAILLLL